MNTTLPEKIMHIDKQDIDSMKILATDIYESKCLAGELITRVKGKLIPAQLSRKITVRDFYRITALMNPQMRAPLWENYFIERYGFARVSPQLNRGDMKKNGHYYEYKASGFNARGELNLIQIRPWQKCDYIFQYVSGNGAKTFFLTKNELSAEMKVHKATPAHGTREANRGNPNVEYRMTIGQETMKTAWKKYLIKNPAKIEAN